ncbi:hypothetical protein [Sphingomonas sp.]|uniref:hypothetical protein n=1 Tax=Sphingomonas sp. TaxID=28214 RepID=UPI003D6D5DB0
MTAPLIAWLGGIVGAKFARPLLIGLAAAVAVALLGLGKCRYDAAVIARHDGARNAGIAAQGRAGEARAADERRIDDARIRNQTQEITHATQSIPDRAVSDRQHARACLILRRQARPGDPVPAGC